jgi:hypothetical protein
MQYMSASCQEPQGMQAHVPQQQQQQQHADGHVQETHHRSATQWLPTRSSLSCATAAAACQQSVTNAVL